MLTIRKILSRSLLALGLLAVLATSVPAQWVANPTNGHFYRLTENQYYGIHDESENDLTPNWMDAEAEAQTYNPNAHLVTINNQEENNWLVETFGSATSFWIGFTDHSAYSSEGNWVWVSGQPVTFTNWDFIQPDNYLQGEDCAHLIHNGSPFWNDLGNDDSHGAGVHSPYYGIVEVPGELVADSLRKWAGIKALYR